MWVGRSNNVPFMVVLMNLNCLSIKEVIVLPCANEHSPFNWNALENFKMLLSVVPCFVELFDGGVELCLFIGDIIEVRGGHLDVKCG